MALPIAAPAALGAIRALVRFSGRVDVIRSAKEATVELPFALPPAPDDDEPHIDPMIAFYRSERGTLVLELSGLRKEFALLTAGDPRRAGEDVFNARGRLLKNYYEAAAITPESLVAIDPAGRAAAPDPDLFLAYYVVRSHRLSRNPELTRILLAAADTLLEFGAENAGLLTSDPRARKVVEAFLVEFAGRGDFDDAPAEQILRRLLGATVAAAVEHYGDYADRPALAPLFSALADVRAQLGDDFAARIISIDGFEHVIGAYLVHVGDDPSFLLKDETLAKALGAILKDIGTDLPAILADPRALTGVLEVALVSAADHVPEVLEAKLGGKPLLATMLRSVATAVGDARAGNPLFGRIADGSMLAAIYRTALEAVAADPSLIGVAGGADSVASKLVAGLAKSLASHELEELLSVETLREVGADSLEILARHPRLVGNDEFATRVVGAALTAAARVVGNATSPAELLDVVEATVTAAADNLSLVRVDDRLAAVITAFSKAISAAGLQSALSLEGRKALLGAMVDAVMTNPLIWGELTANELVAPLAEAIARGLKDDPARLLTGSTLVPALSRILIAAARRGRVLIDGEVEPDTLRMLLAASLARAEKEVGRTIDAETLPDFLERVVTRFLGDPVEIEEAALEQIFSEALEAA